MAVSSTSYTKENPSPHAFKSGNPYVFQPGVINHDNAEDKEEWRLKLIAWGEKDNSHKLNEFSASHKIDPKRISDWAKACPRFAEALRYVKSMIASRREMYVNLGEMDKGNYNRYQKMYDYHLQEHEREEMAFEYSLKNDVATAPVQINLIEKPYRKPKDSKDE